MIARKPGIRFDAFKLSMDGWYELLPCKYYRKLCVIDKVLVARSKFINPETKIIVAWRRSPMASG